MKLDVPKEIHLSPELEGLRPALVKWQHLAPVVAADFPQRDDADYFTEKSYCSLLATAANLAGIPTAVEISRPGRDGRGQIDLVLKLNRGILTAEAKLTWVGYSDGIGVLDDRLEAARVQVKNRPADWRLGLAFVVLQRHHPDPSGVLAALRTRVDELTLDLVAWADLEPEEYWYALLLAGTVVTPRGG